MAICEDCNREMTLAASCEVRAVDLAGARYLRIPYQPRWNAGDSTKRCGDCGVRPGGYHHLGCDLERCPRCHGQLFCCDCWHDAETDEVDEVEPQRHST
jgi:hypothetical protein